MKQYYKLARPDGFDFYTGKTINYREGIGRIVKCPNDDKKKGLCSSGVIHASENPNDCFAGAKIPCSAYLIEGKPVIETKEKCGFLEIRVLSEICDLDSLFGWRYNEASSPISPLLIKSRKPTKADIELLRQWASVWDSVWDSVGASVGDSVGASVWVSVGASVWVSVWDSVGASVGDSVRASVGASVRASVGDSVGASVWAYAGSMFPNIKKWKYTSRKEGEYPYQSCVDLWKRGFVPSFDGKIWRLHAGKDAKIVYELDVEEIQKGK